MRLPGTGPRTQPHIDLAYDIVCRGDIPMFRVLRVRKKDLAYEQDLADKLRDVYYASLISDKEYSRGVKRIARMVVEKVGLKKIENRRKTRFNRETRCYELAA